MKRKTPPTDTPTARRTTSTADRGRMRGNTSGRLWNLYTVEPLYCGHLGDIVKCPGVLISGGNFY